MKNRNNGSEMNHFRTISDSDIEALCISPMECIEWAAGAFAIKQECMLSPKISYRPTADSFFTTMPCCMPLFNRMGVKVISRIPGNVPSLKSYVQLFDMTTGDLLVTMDANWITAMRTGAVAALAAKTFATSFASSKFGFVGLGSTATATLSCLSALSGTRAIDVCLLEYKNRANLFAAKFNAYPNLSFHISHTREELVRETDVLFSCVTVMHEQFLSSDAYKEGYVLIPVHTKGFENCDGVFDHVFGDDIKHIREFKHFKDFKSFAEFGEVLAGRANGRISQKDRILVYNVGIGLQDVYFASRIFDRITES